MDRSSLIPYLLLLIGFNCFAEQKPYEILNLEEGYDSNVDVSGGVLTAFQFEGADETAQLDNLFIAKSENSKNLNIKILSIDGKYHAEFAVKFLPTDKEWVEVAIPSKYTEELASYKAEEVSVYAYQEVITKRNKKTHFIFPTAWGEPNTLQQKFYINSAGDFAKLAYVDINIGKQVTFCEPISRNVKTSFNYECTLPPNAQPKNNFIVFTTTAGAKGKKYKIWQPKK
ncbi:hypothetical protein [Thalassotalea sp. ND16A]|uniref:hypothetical protein n=1 Tax=Thalassotalea sp. ND16A TaxID=1535422 RepID=UPI00051A5D13|nr:hypothetical protein [Thalassotalea sp. ND16A]KGJ90255.1 hypothetical protein ND16A_1985 [Thalassotalea sp. ND16A]